MTVINTSAPVNEIRQINFRWTYVALPIAALFLAIIIAAVFYGKLPAETAYRFSDGAPVNWIARGVLTAWALGLQLVFVLLSLGMTLIITGAARRIKMAENQQNRMLFTIIGNIMALPQIIIAYATLDIFLYNIDKKNLPPLWAFALAVMVAGGIVLAAFFAGAVAQSKKLKSKTKSGSESDVRK